MRKIPKWLQGILFLLLTYFLFFFRLPLYLEVPGSIFSLDEMIEVENQLVDTPGKFYITTVGIQQLTPATIGRSFFPYQDLVSEAELFGEYDDFESYNRLQKYYMESSINHAIKAAFDAAGKDYDFEYNGVHVLQITKDSNFLGKLKMGDLVKAVDGNEFSSSAEFINYIGDKNVGDQTNLTIERDGESLNLTGQLIELESGKTGIGIALVDHTKIITDPTVRVQAGNIGGPSAGLMFSLELYTKIIDQNIRKEYNIAGTGTIDSEGKVGRIGGIEKKVIAADRENIDYFFAPNDDLSEEYLKINPGQQSNYQLALDTVKEIESDMVIVPVKTIMDAIEYLENLQLKEKVFKEGEFISLHEDQNESEKFLLVA